MFSDGLVDLVEKGVITNAHKDVHQGKIVGGFCLGSQRLYDFIDHNPQLGEHSLSVHLKTDGTVSLPTLNTVKKTDDHSLYQWESLV